MAWSLPCLGSAHWRSPWVAALSLHLLVTCPSLVGWPVRPPIRTLQFDMLGLCVECLRAMYSCVCVCACTSVCVLVAYATYMGFLYSIPVCVNLDYRGCAKGGVARCPLHPKRCTSVLSHLYDDSLYSMNAITPEKLYEFTLPLVFKVTSVSLESPQETHSWLLPYMVAMALTQLAVF